MRDHLQKRLGTSFRCLGCTIHQILIKVNKGKMKLGENLALQRTYLLVKNILVEFAGLMWDNLI